MLKLRTNKGIFNGYVDIYKYMLENNLNKIELISINFYSRNLEFLRDNSNTLYKSLFRDLKVYNLDEIYKIIY